MSMKKSRLRIGEILIAEKLLSDQDLEKALEEQKKRGGHLGVILVKMGMVKEIDLAMALAKQMGLPYAKGDEVLIPATDQKLETLFPVEFAREHAVLPLSRSDNSLRVAMADPLDLITIDSIQQMTRCEVDVIVAARSDILKQLNTLYGERTLLKEAIAASDKKFERVIEHDADSEIEDLDTQTLIAKAEEAPIIRLVDVLIRQAIDDRASDIHIEPMKDKVNIRYRIDGVLYEVSPPPKHLFLPVVSRIKILSGMDIAEKRLPQDGAFSIRYEDRLIDLRISTIPTIYGEKVVLRILDKGKLELNFRALGFEAKQLETIKNGFSRPYGLVIITGPTGSGKTTTLYAGISFLNNSKKNIVTIEDPVEYKLAGINQVQIKPEIGLTFASGLRAMLRQDPDIIMVGEIRDLETAQICIRAALTGHLIVSTLHTNDAIGAIPRLIAMGVEPYLAMSSLNLLVAQRLTRKLCQECKEPYEPEKEIVTRYGLHTELLYKAKGCNKCSFMGYKGRISIYETLLVSDNVKQMILKGNSMEEIRATVYKAGMVPMRETGMKKVEQGLTTIEEVLQVTIEEF
jgi:type IV-A pilus assembly ATPase PilB